MASPHLQEKKELTNVKKRNYFTKYGEQARAVLLQLFRALC